MRARIGKVRGLYCNSCGYPNPEEQMKCGTCGAVMASEPHISDVTSGNVVICGACGGTNLKDSAYCRECGWRLSAVKIPASGAKDDTAEARRRDASGVGETRGGTDRVDIPDETRAAVYETYPSSAESRALSSTATEPRKNLLEKLDLMELELEAKTQEAPPEPERKAEPDKLDEYEEALKNIAFNLDTLISNLLKAEAQEYAFSDSPRIDEKNFAKNSAGAKRDPFKKKARNTQYIIILIALIAAIFLVGMTFGLWGSYFFGI